MASAQKPSSKHFHTFQNTTIGANIPRGGNAFTRWLGRFFIRLQGWKVEGKLPDEPKLIAAVGPHTSNWDFCVAMPFVLAMGLKISYLGKHTLFIWPFKYFFEWLGGIPLDRTHAHGVVGEMSRAFAEREQLLLALAPEGSRSKVKDLKTGFLHMSAETGVPIILIGLDFASKTMKFGPVIHASGDIEKDTQIVMDYYASQTGKKPEQA
jgi:1-acyl-sn-glycerol-3-phosphate acyltransferase